MIAIKFYFVTAIVIGALTLTGCQQVHHLAVEGGDLTVTPVTYTYTISLKNKKRFQAKEELFAYLRENKKRLLIYGAEISWKGKNAKKLAQDASTWLVESGTPSELVNLRSSDSEALSMISLSTTIYQVQTRTCNERVIGQYQSGDDGCYSDNLRWQAMLHPDRKLAGQNRITVLPQNGQ
ncbi:hypothetical protein GCE9029_02401 [Grimontia celer]|uniref:Lipoprotein n=1 Tax=Grimontia celer TaxID=1796497 RepID=A0A128F2S9_9GAMM|nr:hypothetical protein [Grimontia celer]CZF81108.1 hypothetical protein GCE9029_02401 [Grimontia celer]